MLQTTRSLIGFSLSTKDGEIGKVKDLYFDDHTWTIRYLVVETANWLFGRKVLIAPLAILKTLKDSRTLVVDMTKEQVKHSPDIDTDKPVSRQSEADLYKHYSWPYGSAGMGYPTIAMLKDAGERTNDRDVTEQHFDKHLRSYKHITDYKIYNKEGVVGECEDFFLNTNNWSLPYLILQTAESKLKKKSFIPTNKVISIQLDTKIILIDVSIKLLKKSLKIDPGEFLTEEQKQKLFKDFNGPV